ncbi:MAG TPA: hypothetical protein VHM88_06580 [Candidatus Acidoferrales bacterium]|nr:hypothetical protein [Candidatus Acidoferrales bacterium]
MKALLILEALTQRLGQELLDVRVQVKTLEQLEELTGDCLLTGVFLKASAFVARASVIDVPAFVDLAGHRTAAVSASKEAREGEFVALPLRPARTPVVEHSLYLLEEVPGDDGLVFAAIEATFPHELPGVHPIPQHLVHAGRWDLVAAGAVAETSLANLACDFFECVITCCIQGKDLGNEWRSLRIWLDPAVSIRQCDIPIPEWRMRRPHPLLGFLTQALGCLLGQVVDVVLGHEDLDPVHELLGRA